ncbi:MAG: PGF-CTERM sorting domain-containing protein [Archaeoglobaceae archaeon]|nr:PGF-CTERM sorting domain-containing protein [Archaeoglobaceae archaeon]MDW8128739.1 PGF-CTERM sorting domain-containing protein [Archaeoglobaceae archaeon]
MVTPTTPEPTPTPTPKPFIPGFEAIFAIAGLIALAYLMNKAKRRE